MDPMELQKLLATLSPGGAPGGTPPVPMPMQGMPQGGAPPVPMPQQGHPSAGPPPVPMPQTGGMQGAGGSMPPLQGIDTMPHDGGMGGMGGGPDPKLLEMLQLLKGAPQGM